MLISIYNFESIFKHIELFLIDRKILSFSLSLGCLNYILY